MECGNPFDLIFGKLSFRKLYHFAGGILIFIIIYIFDGLPIYLIGLTYLALFWFWGRRISFAIIAFLILYVITQSKFATLGAVIIFTVGDGMAAVFGAQFGKSKWIWHDQKTIIGTIAFFLSSVVSLALYSSMVMTGSGIHHWMVILIPAFVACFLECLPITFIRDRKPDDNLVVILASGLTLFFLQDLLQLQTFL